MKIEHLRTLATTLATTTFLATLLASCEEPHRSLYDDSEAPTYGFVQPVLITDVAAEDYSVLRVPVTRTEAATDAHVLLEFFIDSLTATIFSMPEPVVHFVAGSYASSANISFDLEKLAFGDSYKFQLAVFDPTTQSVNGGVSAIDVSVSRRITWVVRDSATWTDGLVSYSYGVEQLSSKVELHEAAEVRGLYRIKNPYGYGVYRYTEAGDVTKDPCYLMINAIDSTKVTVPEQSLGINYGEGEMVTLTAPSRYGSRVDSTITFPANTLLLRLPGYSDFGSEECRLVLKI